MIDSESRPCNVVTASIQLWGDGNFDIIWKHVLGTSQLYHPRRAVLYTPLRAHA